MTVERIFGLHGWPRLPFGRLSTCAGPMMASTDVFDIEIRGAGGHAAHPEFTADPIVAASQFVSALQTVVSRNVSPVRPAVVSVTQFHAGSGHNVIPGSAALQGTVRALDELTRRLLHERIERISRDVAGALGCSAEVDMRIGYPVTRNDAETARHALDLLGQTLGEDAAVELTDPIMGAEDFSFYGEHAAACFLLLGTRPEGVEDYPDLHTALYDFNDDALPIGVRTHCALALHGNPPTT
jgi:amidohydrolase